MFEYTDTVGFCCVGTGWNSFRYVDGKMSPEPPVGEILILGELFLYICNILKKLSPTCKEMLDRIVKEFFKDANQGSGPFS